MSTSRPDDAPDDTQDASPEWPALPTETEIYLLPDGQVIIADLPAELSQLAAALSNPSADTAPTAPTDDPSRSAP